MNPCDAASIVSVSVEPAIETFASLLYVTVHGIVLVVPFAVTFPADLFKLA